MKHRHFVSAGVSLLAFLLVPFGLLAQAPTAGTNINMVSGTDWTNGDPFLQRQNEPSIADSTRNTLHLLAGANDYRTVDLPGLLGIDEPGDAWLGLYKSFDGGLSWKSTLLPGYPLDISAAGLASPIHGFQAGADPTVRAGTNGMFYYSGIAFNRGTNGLGAIFISTFIDNNNKENGDPTIESGSMTNLAPSDPIRYIHTVMIDSGTSGQFLDKPWLAVDVPRGNATCTLNYTNPDGTPGSETIPAGRAFLAYSNFTGGTTSKIEIVYSTDCGTTWTKPAKISQTNNINQGTIIAIDPSSAANSQATVYVAWRRFNASGQPDAIVISKSTDGGRTWGKAVSAITFPATCPTTPTGVGCPFDQVDSGTMFRSNAYPTLAVDNTGRVYLAVSQRQANGDGRIVMTVSSDGVNWPNAPTLVDNGPIYADDGTPFSNLSGRGHQIMPALTFNAGQLTLVYYDLREDHTIGIFQPKADLSGYTETRSFVAELLGDPAAPSVFNSYVDDSTLITRRHTVDVQGAQAAPQASGILTVPAFSTFRVSRYAYGINPYDSSSQPEQLQVNPPDLPMFVQGTKPFIGDYIDIAAAPTFIFQNGKWGFNTSTSNPQFFFATWTDNRNVIAPPDNDWTKYAPVYSASNPQGSTNVSKFDPTQTVSPCNNVYAGTRNQDVYTARIDPGLVLSSPGNSKTLGVIPNTTTLLLRAFPLYLRNNTTVQRTFLLTIANQPALSNGNPDPAGFASFQQSGGVVTSLSVTVPAFSSIARSVFVQSTNPTASVMVTGTDTTSGSTLNGSLTFNPDPNSPQIIDPDSLVAGQNPSILNAEAYNPALQPPVITIPSTSSLILNPAIQNPAIQNPAIQNQNYSASLNPAIQNPAIQNPAIQNPAIQNPAIQNTTLADAVYNVTNTGNTATTYAVKLYGNNPTNATLQLILAKQYLTNTQDTTTGCQLSQQNTYNVFANVANPVFTPAASLGNPDIFDSAATNATLSLAPGETGQIIIRGNLSQTDMQTLLGSLTPVVVAHAATNGVNAATLTVTTQSLPDAFEGTAYSQTVTVLGGTGKLTWTVTVGSLPPGLTLDPATGIISGTPTATGDYGFTVQITDSTPGTPNMVTEALTIHVANQLRFTSTTIPDALIGVPYSTSIPATGGSGALTYSLLSGSLPSGLTFSSGGTISGTPDATNVAGTTFSPQFQVVDSGTPPQTVSAILTLRALNVLSAGGATTTLPDAVAGQQYTTNLTATGGSGNFTWSVTGGTLPPNLILNGSTGQISGIPQSTGTSTFTLTVQDQSNPTQSSSTSASLLVSGKLAINLGSSTILDGVVGKPYSATLVATGGTAPLSWSVTARSSLPAGLSLSSGGQITGIPTIASPSGVTTSITATDSGHPMQSATASITIRIGAPLAITTTSLAAGTDLTAYKQTLAATGGIGNYSWSLAAGSGPLPTGLALSTAGIISGTPTVNGSFAFTVQVVDGSSPQQAATQSLSITINNAFTVVFTVQPSNTSPGSQITPSVKVKVTDAKGNTVKNAVCVASLGVNPSGGTLSGTTTATTGNNGIAIFASQSINLSGTGYQMLVTVISPAGGGSVLSVPFNIK